MIEISKVRNIAFHIPQNWNAISSVCLFIPEPFDLFTPLCFQFSGRLPLIQHLQLISGVYDLHPLHSTQLAFAMAPITAKTKAKAAQMSPRKRKITKKPPPTAQKPIWGKPLREEKGLAKARFPPLGGRLYYYDFSPFLTCPAVVSHARSHHAGGRIVPVPIPETSIPSPLANNLAPQTLFDLKRFLVGMFDRFGRNGLEGQGGNGKEIWETWLRAWCLWNNYYIQGRINHDWIKRCSMLKGDKIRAGSTTSGHIDEKLRRFLSSGGFCAMKHMDLYQETSTETQYVKEDWHDAVENSIWRPRRLGEEDGDPIIDLDEDLDAFHAESGLNVDGGVDCGRSPYPVPYPYPVFAPCPQLTMFRFLDQ